MAQRHEFVCKLLLALGDPHQRTHRIAHRHRLDKVFEVLDDRAVGLDDRTATASLATNATGIERRCGEVLQAGDNAFARDSGYLCDRRDASPTRGPCLARREQALTTLVPLRAVRLPPHANRPSVDHATRLDDLGLGEITGT